MGCCALSGVGPGAQRWDDHPAREKWSVVKELGAGTFSKVVLCRHKETKQLAALKVVFLDAPGLDLETEGMLCNEGKILLNLDHPNVVKCQEIIESPKAHVFVLEYLKGCNVLDGIYYYRDAYSEKDAAGIFTQLVQGTAYLHSKGILHRDIKPENVVYQDMPAAGKAPVVKIVDLGLAARYSDTEHDRGVLGSAGFVAPEIVKGKYHTPAMDVFSMGVLLFVMLVGRKPWDVEQCEKLRYTKGKLSGAPGFKDPRWLDLSPDAKSLIIGMLQFDPKKRLTAEQVLQHEWVKSKGGLTLRILGENVALGAATVAEMRRLKYLCHGVVALHRKTAKQIPEKKRSEIARLTEDAYVKRFEQRRYDFQAPILHGYCMILPFFAIAPHFLSFHLLIIDCIYLNSGERLVLEEVTSGQNQQLGALLPGVLQWCMTLVGLSTVAIWRDQSIMDSMNQYMATHYIMAMRLLQSS